MSLINESYSLNELRNHIKTKLGGSVWRLEGMEDDQRDTLDQAISEAVMIYSSRCPRYGWEVIAPKARGQYTLKEPGFGVWRVDFIAQSVIPGVVSGLNRNLTGVNTLGVGTSGSGAIAQFLAWQRSYRRATTNDPHWVWDDDAQILYIKALHFQKACVYTHLPRSFDTIRLVHKDYIRRLALCCAKRQLAENRRKFNGTITGPGGQAIDLNADALSTEAEAEYEKLMAELRKFQPRAIPVYD